MNRHSPGSDQSLSIWIDTSRGSHYGRLERDVEADVAIVGGGVTGITAAYLLARLGASVVLIEKGRIGTSETGHTTAHLVETIDADYRDLVRAHGEDGARLNTEAIRGALNQIKTLVKELSIDCGFRDVDAFLYAEDEKGREYLERQHEYLQRSGVVTEWTSSIPLPFPTIGGLRFRNQAVFHVRDYLLGVADAAVQLGVQIFENTLATDIEGAEAGGRATVQADWRPQGRDVPRRRHAAAARSYLHAHGMHGCVERRRTELGLSVPRLAIQRRWRGTERSRYTSAQAHETGSTEKASSGEPASGIPAA